ncbi:MAG: Re/Si-specific NAD(P)(+) transhydrogenase subunit alpha [Defluviicoccus sp.]|nr:Re/Si-specific NAD(P)(+) transhydrogenase subunit alpha [Defluviicoccus sp.]MDE0383460.1 Re/Si-specific NAD(P)(+) transhydrogenase subunit alpha [Defluviicoccus sp.]
MKLSVPKERRRDERRVAASPDTAKKLVGLGFEVVVETGAGIESGFPDAAYEEAGAAIAADQAAALSDGDVVLKVQRPLIGGEEGGDELALMKPGAVVIGALGALQHANHAAAYAEAGLTTFSLELLPRITRAQSMDILSSQSNIAGYRAVIDGVAAFGRALPMMMTAAGTIPPARVLVLGAGVAGLQAIATARRLGAIVTGYDVRPAVKEQVESLGAKFLAVDQDAAADAETAGGYAREMGASYKEREAEVLRAALERNDIVVCTALIPGRPAPVLIAADMVRAMRPGSVIVDLAVEQGGNCELSEPGKVAMRHGVTVIGHLNMPSRLAENASSMYARNLLNFLTPFVDREEGTLAIDWDDEIVAACLITRGGAVVHPLLIARPADKDVA